MLACKKPVIVYEGTRFKEASFEHLQKLATGENHASSCVT